MLNGVIMTAQIYNALPSLLTKMENTVLSHELVASISSDNRSSQGYYFYLTLISEVRLVVYFELEYQLAYREFLLQCLGICRAYDRLSVENYNFDSN